MDDMDDRIENSTDDIRMAMQDLAANGPNEDDYKRALEAMRHCRALLDLLMSAAP